MKKFTLVLLLFTLIACSEDESPTMTTDEEMGQEMDEVGEEMLTPS